MKSEKSQDKKRITLSLGKEDLVHLQDSQMEGIIGGTGDENQEALCTCQFKTCDGGK